MIRFLLPLALLAAGMLAWRALYRRHGKRIIRPTVIGLLLAGVTAMVLTGRMHWVGIVIAALLAGAKELLLLLVRLAPLLSGVMSALITRRRSQQAAGSEDFGPGKMSRSQALAVLGLSEEASREEIIAAHRQLIQKLHPDRKGSAHLSEMINRARDILLDDSGSAAA